MPRNPPQRTDVLIAYTEMIEHYDRLGDPRAEKYRRMYLVAEQGSWDIPVTTLPNGTPIGRTKKTK